MDTEEFGSRIADMRDRLDRYERRLTAVEDLDRQIATMHEQIRGGREATDRCARQIQELIAKVDRRDRETAQERKAEQQARQSRFRWMVGAVIAAMTVLIGAFAVIAQIIEQTS